MRKPFIAITSQYNEDNSKTQTRSRYFNFVSQCGGIPIALPQIDDINDIRMMADKFDGFLFSGGDDVNPKLYGESILPECGFISNERDKFEIALLNEVIKLNKPVFGICRGIQLINVALGGSLYQHMTGHNDVRHDITFHGERINVNSYHHQAVKDLSPLLKVSAYSDDGMVEAVYMPDYGYFTAVQWHPEILSDIDYDLSIRLFTDFITQSQM
jgi:Predicted glutamine amidotransferases